MKGSETKLDFLSDAVSIFSTSIDNINLRLIEAVVEFHEESNDSFYVTERQRDTLYVKVKKLFSDMIVSIKNFINQVKIDVERRVRDAKTESKLRKLYKELKQTGDKSIEVVDVWNLKDYYLKAVSELKKYTKRISKMEYKNTSQIDDDLANFNTTIAKYEKNLEELSNKKKKVSTLKLITFVEDEISGRSKVIDSLNDSITIIDNMKREVNNLEARKAILGPDVIPKHIGLFRRISQKITSFFRNWAAKIISRIVFLFA